MPFGVRCAPWSVWLEGPESPCRRRRKRCSLQPSMPCTVSTRCGRCARSVRSQAISAHSVTCGECADCSGRHADCVGRWRPPDGRATADRADLNHFDHICTTVCTIYSRNARAQNIRFPPKMDRARRDTLCLHSAVGSQPRAVQLGTAISASQELAHWRTPMGRSHATQPTRPPLRRGWGGTHPSGTWRNGALPRLG